MSWSVEQKRDMLAGRLSHPRDVHESKENPSVHVVLDEGEDEDGSVSPLPHLPSMSLSTTEVR